MKDFTTFLTYSGLSTILFLILLLSQTWKKRKANKILSGILLSFLLLFLTYASSYLEWDFIAYLVSPIGYVIPFALGTLIFQYIKTIYTSRIDFRSFIKSLLPFALALLTYSTPQYLLGLPLENELTLFQSILLIIPFLGILHLAYHLFLSNKILKRYRGLVKENYANVSSLDLKWLSIWLQGFVLFLVIDATSTLLTLAYSITSLLYINLFYLVLLIWYVGYYGVKQTHVFLIQNASATSTKTEPSQEKTKNPSSAFDCESEEFTALRSNLEILFVKQEFFKKQHLSLKETADLLNISDKKLSYFFNLCLSTNFYEYVNVHRINYFRKELEEGAADQLTLLAVAFDSGFNSKATFNRVFKQQVGMTPKEFKKTLE